MKLVNKKLVSFVLLISMLAVVFTGCGQKTAKEEVSNQVEESQTSESNDIEKLEIKHAENFDIEYMENDIKVVTDSEGRKLILVPKDGEVPEGHDDKVLVRTPINNVMYTSTPMVGFLGTFNKEELYDSIGAVTTPLEHWTTKEVIERLENGKITYIEQTHTEAANIETVAKLNPEIVFSGGEDQSGMELREKLDEMGINYIVTMDYTEKSDEAYLEWIKLYGAFYNLDKEATEIYDSLIKKMDDLKEAAKNKSQEDKPVVALGMIYDGVVYTNGVNSTIAKNIEAAGGIYALSDLEGEGSVQIGMEEFFDKCKDADILIYSSLEEYTPDKKYLEELEPLMTEFKAFKEDNIYVYEMGYYMNAAADEKFEDLVYIISPDLMPSDHSLRHYVKLPDVKEE